MLCEIITTFGGWNKEKTTAFGGKQSVVPSRQYTSSHILYRDGQNQWLNVQIASLRTLFARFSPFGLFSLSKLEKRLAGETFANNEEVESAVNGYFEKLDGSHYKQGIEAIEHCWDKCIDLKGDHVEK